MPHEVFDLMNIQWELDGGLHQFINNPRINYKIEPVEGRFVPNYTSDYIRANYRPNRCFYTTIIDLLSPSWNKRFAKKLTYEYMYKLIHKRAADANSSWALTLPQLTPFLAKYHLSLVVYTIDNEIGWEYRDPWLEDPKHKSPLSPNPIYVLGHNNHIYRLSESTASISMKNWGKELAAADADSDNLSAQFYLPKNRENVDRRLIEDFTDLRQLMIRDEHLLHENNLAAIKPVKVVVNDIDGFLRETLRENYEPKISLTENMALSTVHIKTDTNEYTVQKIAFPAVPDFDFRDNDHLNDFMSFQGELADEIMNLNTKSFYNDQVMSAFNTYNRGAVTGRMIPLPDVPLDHNEYNVIFDFKKDYLSCLLDIHEIPVINEFDSFMAYNSEPISSSSFYLIHVPQDINAFVLLLVSREYDLVSGHVVQQLQEIPSLKNRLEILAVLSPSKFVAVDFAPIIRRLYDSDMDIVSKKLIPNINMGLATRRYNKRITANLFKTQEEAHAHFKHVIALLEGEELIYAGCTKEKKSLKEGFYLIGQLIYDLSRIKLFKLAAVARKYGNVIGVKTDAVFLDARDPAAIHSLRSIAGFAITADADNSFETIGTLRVIADGKLNCRQITIQKNTFPNGFIRTRTLPELKYPTDEYAPFDDLIVSRTAILGKYPGVGKTYATIEYARRNLADIKQAIWVVPNNALREDLILNSGVRAITAHRLMGLNRAGEKAKARFNIKDIKLMVFDEIFMQPLQMLRKIARFMDKHSYNDDLTPKITFLCTGDQFQNEPIDDYKYPREYYKQAVFSMFSRVILLRQNKRIKDPAENKRFCALFDDLKDLDRSEHAHSSAAIMNVLRRHGIPFVKTLDGLYNEPDTINVTHYNAIADQINNHFHPHNQSPFLICENYFDVSRKAVTNPRNYNDPDNDEAARYKFFTNTTYEKINDTTLADKFGRQITLKAEEIKANFRLPYARTGHSLQGITAGNTANIFDIVGNPHLKTNWVIPALSRCRTLNIRVYTGEVNYMALVNGIREMLAGYAEQDDARGMDPRHNITRDEVISLMADPRCKYCGGIIDIHGKTASTKLTLDRVSNHLPHRRNNVVLSCLSCNRAKK
jgi:hypothetical protein